MARRSLVLLDQPGEILEDENKSCVIFDLIESEEFRMTHSIYDFFSFNL